MARRRAPTPTPLDPEDAALFRDAIGPVRELAPAPPPPSAPRPAPAPRQRDADEAQALVASRLHPFEHGDGGEDLQYLKPGLSPRLLRKLKRGDYSVQDEIDLHGLRAIEAASVLRRFLHECRREHSGCVLIVHGKGTRSGDEGPVLKNLVERNLRQRDDVLAFASASAAQGGTGALRVLLASRRRNPATGG